jgi:hypothetical protein
MASSKGEVPQCFGKSYPGSSADDSITSLPDYTQLNMTYTDPLTGRNETCWSHCPLSTDPNIAAQDYLFTAGPRNLTGLQMQLKGWIGDGAGLSSLQLLSEGEFGEYFANG